MKYWKTTKFWGKVRDSFSVLGGLTTAGLAIEQVPYSWIMASAIASILGTLVGIWFSDEDGDGQVDVLQ